MNFETTTPSDSRFDGAARAEPPKPRLSILHLMVWTGLIAAMIGLFRGLCLLLPRSPSAGEMVVLSLLAVYSGMALGGIVLLALRRFRGMRFPTEPGEWLLVVQGCLVLCGLGTLGLLLLAMSHYSFGTVPWLILRSLESSYWSPCLRPGCCPPFIAGRVNLGDRRSRRSPRSAPCPS